MKILSRLVLFISLSLFVHRINAQPKSSPGYQINGMISGAANGTVIQLIDIDELSIIDSTVVQDGKFSFTGKVEQPKSCWLRAGDAYAILQIENVNMEFSSSMARMKFDYSCSGGPEQTLQTQLNVAVRPFEEIYAPAFDSLYYKKFKDSLHERRLAKTFNMANDRYMAIFIAFGKTHINSHIGLDIVYRNRKSIAMDSLILLYNKLPANLLQTDRARGLKTYTQENLVKKGQQFRDFQATDINGKTFKLSSLKGSYVYLIFGSIGCAPCRTENRYIAENYQWLTKHMQIVNFSMDLNKKEWLAAAKLDGITWKNISDLEGMAGRIKTLYDVVSMPTSFLINPSGTVVEKFVGYSAENFKKIQDIIKQ